MSTSQKEHQMRERDGYIPGVPCWVDTTQPDPQAAVAFYRLGTRDPDGAKAFYGSVFGWEVLDLGGGGAMWMLPGYGEFLEAREPGLRERQAQAGAPEGFADVVATLNPIGEEEPDAPAN